MKEKELIQIDNQQQLFSRVCAMTSKWTIPVVVVAGGIVMTSVIAQPPNTASKEPPATNKASEQEAVVVRLRSSEAQVVLDMLQNLLDADEFSAVRATADTRTNALILRGTQNDTDRVLRLVQKIDSEPSFE